MEKIRAFIGIGSNLSGPRNQVQTAFAALDRMPDSRLVNRSSMYRSDPLGPPGQPDYINAVAEIETTLDPFNLLDVLHAIERRQGRVRVVRWGPRTLDLDLLLYANLELADARLSLPHPGMRERPFVLYPLSELATDIEIPGLGALSGLLDRCAPAGLSKLDDKDPVAKGA